MDEELHLLSLYEAPVSTSVRGGGREGEGKRKKEREEGKEKRQRRKNRKKKEEGRERRREGGKEGAGEWDESRECAKCNNLSCLWEKVATVAREDEEAKVMWGEWAEESLLRLKLREFSVIPSTFKMTLEPSPKMNPIWMLGKALN